MKKRKTIIIAAAIIFVSAIVSVCCMNYIEKKNRIVKVEVGDSVSAVIKGDGSLWMWGYNRRYQLGDGTGKDVKKPKKIMSDVRDISIGEGLTGAIKKDGSLWVWGFGYSTLGDGITEGAKKPKKITNHVKNVKMGQYVNAILKDDDSLWIWDNVGIGPKSNGNMVKIDDNVKQVALSDHDVVYIKDNREMWALGLDYWDAIGIKENAGRFEQAQKVEENVEYISVNVKEVYAILNNGELYRRRGTIYEDEFDDEGSWINGAEKILDHVKFMSTPLVYYTVLKTDGSVWTWGDNFSGRLGNGTLKNSNMPEQVIDNAKQVSTSRTHAAVLKNDGTLWVWGDNKYGELGDGTTKCSVVPKEIKVGDSGLFSIR